MGGDWIPISVDLPYKPEIARIAEAIRRSPDEVVGLLVRFWSWAQAHCSDGVFPGYTPETLAKSARVSASFLRAMVSVGWLDVTETGTAIPKFDRWFSGGAKRRLMTAQRVANSRGRARKEVKDDCNAESNADVTLPALQKRYHRIEEKELTTTSSSNEQEKGGSGEKGVEAAGGPVTPEALRPDHASLDGLFRSHLAVWGQRGPRTQRDRVLLWRACYLASCGIDWARAALECLATAKPNNPGAYLQRMMLELAPREPNVAVVLARIPVPEELKTGPPAAPAKPKGNADEKPLSREEAREMLERVYAVLRSNASHPPGSNGQRGPIKGNGE